MKGFHTVSENKAIESQSLSSSFFVHVVIPQYGHVSSCFVVTWLSTNLLHLATLSLFVCLCVLCVWDEWQMKGQLKKSRSGCKETFPKEYILP